MRLRIKFKIEDKENEIPFFLNKNSNYNNMISLEDLKKKSDSLNGTKYDSFSAIMMEFDSNLINDDGNISNKIQKQLKSYDEKSKKILFPLDINKINFVHQFKEILHDYINLKYYDLNFLSEFLKGFQKNIIFEVQIIDLEIDNYKICEDFILKDLLKDNDNIDVSLKITKKITNKKEKEKTILSNIQNQLPSSTDKSHFFTNQKRKRDIENNKRYIDLDSSNDSELSEEESIIDKSIIIIKFIEKKQIKTKIIEKKQKGYTSSSSSSDSENKNNKYNSCKNSKFNETEFKENKNVILDKSKEDIINKMNISKSDELIFVKKNKNKDIKTNIQNQNNFYKSRDVGPNEKIDNLKINHITFEKKINQDSKDYNEKEFLEENYCIIPTENIEKINFLNNEYPDLFLKDSKICFRLYEISEITGELAVSNYKFGKIKEYIEENKNFLIELEKDHEKNNKMFYCDDHEPDIVCVNLRDFIELRIKRNKNFEFPKPNGFISKNQIEGENQKQIQVSNNDINIIDDKIEIDNNKTNKDISQNENINNSNQNIIQEQKSEIEENKNIVYKEKKNNTTKKDNSKGVSIFNRIINSQIRKQIEYYFSDKNYYQDSFLLEKAAKNSDNYNPLTLYDAMKESDYVEFNEEKTKIRKKNIHKEFLFN